MHCVPSSARQSSRVRGSGAECEVKEGAAWCTESLSATSLVFTGEVDDIMKSMIYFLILKGNIIDEQCIKPLPLPSKAKNYGHRNAS